MVAKAILIAAVCLGHFVPIMKNSLIATRVLVVRLILMYYFSPFPSSVTMSGLVQKDKLCLKKWKLPFQTCQPTNRLDLMASLRSYTYCAFFLEYLCVLSRKELTGVLIKSLFPVAVYRQPYLLLDNSVLKRVKKMRIQAAAKTFFFKLRTSTLPLTHGSIVKVYMCLYHGNYHGNL